MLIYIILIAFAILAAIAQAYAIRHFINKAVDEKMLELVNDLRTGKHDDLLKDAIERDITDCVIEDMMDHVDTVRI